MTILQEIAPILEKREIQNNIHQMSNMEEQNNRIESSDDDYRSPLNLGVVGMTPPHSYH